MKMIALVALFALTSCVDNLQESPDAGPDASLDQTYYLYWTPINSDCTLQANLPDKLVMTEESVRWTYAGCTGWGHDGAVEVLSRDSKGIRLSQVTMTDCSDRKLTIESFQLYWMSLTGTTAVRAVCTTDFRISLAQ